MCPSEILAPACSPEPQLSIIPSSSPDMFLSSTTSPEPAVPGPFSSSRSPTCIRLSLLSQPAETISSQTQNSCSPNVELSSSASPGNTQASPETEVTATATSHTMSYSTSNSVCYAPNSSDQSDKIDSSRAETSSPVTAVASSVATVSHSASVDLPSVPVSDTLSIVSHVFSIRHSPGALLKICYLMICQQLCYPSPPLP